MLVGQKEQVFQNLQITVSQYSSFTNFTCMVSMGVEVGTY